MTDISVRDLLALLGEKEVRNSLLEQQLQAALARIEALENPPADGND